MLKGTTTQSNLQISCNPYQNIHDIFHRIRPNNPKVYIEPQKTLNNQSNLEKKNKAGNTILPDFRLYYKELYYKELNAMVLASNRHTDK